MMFQTMGNAQASQSCMITCFRGSRQCPYEEFPTFDCAQWPGMQTVFIREPSDISVSPCSLLSPFLLSLDSLEIWSDPLSRVASQGCSERVCLISALSFSTTPQAFWALLVLRTVPHEELLLQERALWEIWADFVVVVACLFLPLFRSIVTKLFLLIFTVTKCAMYFFFILIHD